MNLEVKVCRTPLPKRGDLLSLVIMCVVDTARAPARWPPAVSTGVARQGARGPGFGEPGLHTQAVGALVGRGRRGDGPWGDFSHTTDPFLMSSQHPRIALNVNGQGSEWRLKKSNLFFFLFASPELDGEIHPGLFHVGRYDGRRLLPRRGLENQARMETPQTVFGALRVPKGRPLLPQVFGRGGGGGGGGDRPGPEGKGQSANPSSGWVCSDCRELGRARRPVPHLTRHPTFFLRCS